MLNMRSFSSDRRTLSFPIYHDQAGNTHQDSQQVDERQPLLEEEKPKRHQKKRPSYIDNNGCDANIPAYLVGQ